MVITLTEKNWKIIKKCFSTTMLTAHFLFSSVVVQRFSEFSLLREQFSNLHLESDVKLGMSIILKPRPLSSELKHLPISQLSQLPQDLALPSSDSFSHPCLTL